MRFYVYCLVEGADELPYAIHGIGGVPVRLLKSDRFSLLVSDFAGEVVPVTRENAVAHAAVIQNVLKRKTPLPFRFGTLVSEQQVESYLNTRREALKSKLGLVRGCVEMSVKIISNRNETEDSAVVSSEEKPGTAFLAEKRREILGSEVRAAEAKRVAEWLECQVAEVVKEIKTDTNPIDTSKTNQTNKLILSSAHLVERDRVDEFRKKVAEARAQRPELHFLVSGPWAPYSFADIDLELKTRFGVS